MKKYIFLFILFIQVNLLFSQAPVVSNVSFTQRTDGSLIVDIYYDLTDADGETKTIVIEASADAGSTWDLACTSLTGDVGAAVTPGTNKHVVWDFYADNPNVSGSNYQVRVTASEVGTMTGNDGTIYQTVKIGNQWWMAEDLRETQYRNNDAIPHVTDNTAWAGLTTGAYCYYNNNSSYASIYGALYNWFALTDGRNIAPAGWHVPSDAEWTTLSTYLGGTSVAGGKLKETGTTHWDSPNTGATNSSGFTARPGGLRYDSSGNFYDMGLLVDYWTATEYNSSSAWYCELYNNNAVLSRSHNLKLSGFSVRLVKD